MSLVPFKITKDLKYIDYLNTSVMEVYLNTPVDKFFEGKEDMKYLIKYIPIEGTNEKLCLYNKGASYGSLSVDTNLNFSISKKDSNEPFKNVVGNAIKAFGAKDYRELFQFVTRKQKLSSNKKYTGKLIKHMNNSILKLFMVCELYKIIIPEFEVEFVINPQEYRKEIKVYNYGDSKEICTINSNVKTDVYDRNKHKCIVLSRRVKTSGVYYTVRSDTNISEYSVEQIFESKDVFLGVTKNGNSIVIEDMNDVYEYDMNLLYDTYKSRKIENKQKTDSLRLLGRDYSEVMTEGGALSRLHTSSDTVIIPNGCNHIMRGSIKLNGNNKCLIVPDSVCKVDNGAINIATGLESIQIDFNNDNNRVISKILAGCIYKYRHLNVTINKLDIQLFNIICKENTLQGAKLEIKLNNKLNLKEAKGIISYIMNTEFRELIEYVEQGRKILPNYRTLQYRKWRRIKEILNSVVKSNSCTDEAIDYINRVINHMDKRYIEG